VTTTKALAPKNEAPKADAASLRALDELAARYSLQSLDASSRFERALLLAEGMQALRKAVAPLVPRILSLQGSPLGFLTDKDKDGGYPAEVVQECLIEATLRGVYPVGNEFNIIARRCYITLNGYRRLVGDVAGLTDLKLIPDVPKAFTGGAIVPVKASWKMHGRPDSLERNIPVRLNAGMGADGAIGKATRKMLASIYAQVTGSDLSGGDDADEPSAAALAALAPAAALPHAGPAPATPTQAQEIGDLTQWLGLTDDGYDDACEKAGVDPSRPFTAADADKVLAALRAMQEKVLREQQDEREAVGAGG
jgi:hypothetical protein